MCQAFLYAVVVTCTLSCIHAHGQSTQRLDQIKDLMCVLILSGLQKEDLDASMLKKLQRYNVNIDHLNNEETLKECKNLKLQDIEKKIASPTPAFTATKCKETSTEKPKVLKNTESVIILQHTFLNPVQPKAVDVSHSNTKSTSTAVDQQILNKKEIEYTNGKPILESVLKFWNNYAKTKKELDQGTSESPSIVTENSINYDQINTLYIPTYENPKGKETISNALTNFLSRTTQNNIELSTTESTTLNVYEGISASDEKTDKLYEDSNKYNLINILEKIQSNNNNPTFEQKYSDTNSQEYATRGPYMSFKEMLASIDQKTAYPFAYEGRVNKFKEEPIKPNNIYTDTLFNPSDNFVKKKTKKSNPIIKINNELEHNLIKNIADNVKAIILQDIRKQIQTTTPVTTTTPTITETTKLTTPTIETTQEMKMKTAPILHESILNKFLELFEQIKSLKTNPIIITQRDKTTPTEGKIERNKYSTPVITLQDQNKQLAIKDLQATRIQKMYPDVIRPKPYDLPTQLHKYRSYYVKKARPRKPQIVQKVGPITIQTNAFEIPPLGVFMNKPENPISQNIIVTTTSNWYRYEKYVDYDAHAQPQTRYNKVYEFGRNFADTQFPRVSFDKADVKQKLTVCSTPDCSHLLPPKLNDRQYVKVNPKEASFIQSDIDRYIAYSLDNSHTKKYLNTSGFHKKLESSGRETIDPKLKVYKNCCAQYRSDMTPSQLSECCVQKISSRHQMSLNPVKRISYDDAHFKNFLKSQKKVTEMLERILAVKNKLRSVENM